MSEVANLTRPVSFAEFMRAHEREQHLFEIDLRFRLGISASNYRTPVEWESLYQDFKHRNRAGRSA